MIVSANVYNTHIALTLPASGIVFSIGVYHVK